MKKIIKEIVVHVEFEEEEINQFRKTLDILLEARKSLDIEYANEKINKAIDGLSHFVSQYDTKGWDFI